MVYVGWGVGGNLVIVAMSAYRTRCCRDDLLVHLRKGFPGTFTSHDATHFAGIANYPATQILAVLNKWVAEGIIHAVGRGSAHGVKYVVYQFNQSEEAV